ncbi:MAG TPA: cytochrome b N-terminal domain-containing protein [Chloroflexota bacterium]|nr:cytochrome b N-terminal domain-containing protein [Chloroflexota bacterium]
MNLTSSLRNRLERKVALEDLLPDELPSYVHAYVYLFGIATIASLFLLILSGIWLAMAGPTWWHVSNLGHYVNSVHFWCVQAFFFFMVLHLWTSFFQGAWRDGRGATWTVGVLCFLVGLGTAFTGYISQQNFDAQWIAVQGKDALNAIGVGAFFNVLNFGQMYGFHIVVLPVAVSALVGLHLLLVRTHGVVRPYPANDREGDQ